MRKHGSSPLKLPGFPRREFLLGAAAAPQLRASPAATANASIGARLPAEWKTSRDPETGRTLRQLTGAKANSYPLYYFIPSITSDNRYLVFHSERSGWVDLYRMDLNDGAITQLTAGRTKSK